MGRQKLKGALFLLTRLIILFMWQESMFVFRNNFLQHRPWEVMSVNRIRLEHKPQLSEKFK